MVGQSAVLGKCEFFRGCAMRFQLLLLGCGVLCGVSGCDDSAMFETKSEQSASVAASVEETTAANPSAPVTGEQPVTDVTQATGVAQKAGVGVGVRGDSLRNEEGVGKMIAAPAVAYFNVREKAVFEIQIPHALNLYKALEGKLPKSHDEFMAKIVRANAIQLPELKPGMQYRYRPDQGELGELWVEPIE